MGNNVLFIFPIEMYDDLSSTDYSDHRFEGNALKAVAKNQEIKIT